MNGQYPETFKVVVADPLDRPGKAEERQANGSESVFGHRGLRLRHVRKSTFMNLGGPVPVHRRWTVAWRKPCDASTGNSDHAILAMKRVMTVERRAWRKEEVANEEIGTALRGGQPLRTQSWRGV